MKRAWLIDISNWVGLSPDTVNGLIKTLVILIIIWAIRWVILRVVTRQFSDDVQRNYFARRAVTYTLTALAFLLVGRLWVSGLRNLGTFFGLLSAGVAVALADLLSSFVGWIFILLRRPYEVGDRVEIDGQRGDVIDIRLFNTYLMECGHWVDADQSTGRTLMIPNGYVFKKSIANFTQGFDFIWDEIPVQVTFESDWKRARDILTEISNRIGQPMSADAQEQIHRAAGRHMIVFKKLTPIVYTTVKDSGIMLTIRYLTPPRQRRGNAARIWEAVLDAFAKEPKIDLAYPTQRAYFNFVEGKPDTMPKN